MSQGNVIDEGYFFFDPQDPIYADHVPGNPVVPGSLIIHAFMTAVTTISTALMPRGIKNFRFKCFLSPGSYAYHIQKKTDGIIACTLLDDQTVVVTGSIQSYTIAEPDAEL